MSKMYRILEITTYTQIKTYFMFIYKIKNDCSVNRKKMTRSYYVDS